MVVAKGVWHGDAIGVQYGGTGATTVSGARTNLQVPYFHDGIIDLDNLQGIGTSATDGNWWKLWNWEHTDSDGTKSYPAALLPTKDGVQNLGLSNFRIKNVYATNYPCGTWNGEPIAISKGGTGATDLKGLQARIFDNQTKLTSTTDIFTLSNGIYHADGSVSKTYNWPYDSDSTRATLFIWGNRNGNNGYWNIFIVTAYSGTIYMNTHHWDQWMGWKKITTTEVA